MVTYRSSNQRFTPKGPLRSHDHTRQGDHRSCATGCGAAAAAVAASCGTRPDRHMFDFNIHAEWRVTELQQFYFRKSPGLFQDFDGFFLLITMKAAFNNKIQK
jgi:hypothetical protein